MVRSPIISGGGASLSCYRGAACASKAYNQGLDDCSADIVVFAHQDVFLPDGWEKNLHRAVSAIEREDPDWGVIGAWGVGQSGEYVGHAWSSGLSQRLGGPFDHPIEAKCIDEFVIILRCASGLKFDEGLPHFHFYAADIVLTARAAGMKVYVADIPVIHNSRPVQSYSGGYTDAWNYMRNKWSGTLPVRTMTTPLTRSILPILRGKWRIWRSLRRRLARATDPSIDPRELVRHLDS
nr:glycosyltransferase [Erythrobacter crassostrea]